MPRFIDGTIWAIVQTRNVDLETVLRELTRLTEETLAPSPENLKSYYSHWYLIASKLADTFT